MTSLSHTPIRGAWTCATCDVPWPCESARGRLRDEYDGASVSLALYLAACMVEAADQLPATPSGELYRRFLGWIGSWP